MNSDAGESESASVRAGRFSGGVIGASEDGSYVYFIADGVLCEREGPTHECVAENAQHEHASSGSCALEGDSEATCNLYVEHYQAGAWQPPRFIASLSVQDKPDWEGEARGLGGQAQLTARVSPNGQYLAFMSSVRSPAMKGSATTTTRPPPARTARPPRRSTSTPTPPASLQCASCEPSGAQADRACSIPASKANTARARSGCSWTASGRGRGSGWRAACRSGAGSPKATRRRSTSPVTSLTPAGCSSTAPSRSSPATRTAQRTSTSTSRPASPRGRTSAPLKAENYDPRSEGCLGLISSGSSEPGIGVP